jgi:heme-degrading monooxygenase HmoA
MFARTATFQFKAHKLDEAIEFFQDVQIPAVKAQKGFHSIYLLVDRATANAVSVAFWDSKEDMMATEESGLIKEWISRFNDYFLKAPTTERYEVCAQG